MNYSDLISEENGRSKALQNAIEYVCKRLNIDNPSSLNCRIRITNCFTEEFRKVHYEPDDSIPEPNGTTIPSIFQSEKYKKSTVNTNYEDKTIILINNSKLNYLSDIQFASIIVHELSHCADYTYKLPVFQNKYGIKIESVKRNTVSEYIGGYFSSYSEIRAKYLQEMFIVEHYQADYEYSFNVDPIRDSSDLYHMEHCVGKIRCWEELFINHPIKINCNDAKKQIKKIRTKYFCDSDYRKCICELYEIWDWNYMISKCDQILTNSNLLHQKCANH